MGGLWSCFGAFRLIVHADAIPNPVVTLVVLLMASSAQAQRPVLDWRTFVVPQYGTRIDYPAGVFIPAHSYWGSRASSHSLAKNDLIGTAVRGIKRVDIVG
jgi:hypothetical protein